MSVEDMSNKMYTRDTFDSSLLHIMKRSPMNSAKFRGGGGLERYMYTTWVNFKKGPLFSIFK